MRAHGEKPRTGGLGGGAGCGGAMVVGATKQKGEKAGKKYMGCKGRNSLDYWKKCGEEA